VKLLTGRTDFAGDKPSLLNPHGVSRPPRMFPVWEVPDIHSEVRQRLRAHVGPGDAVESPRPCPARTSAPTAQS
jgi:hypothetical protein